MRLGRKKPYTIIGISRIPCARCGERSDSQWQICANHNRYLGVCILCDVELNEVVLEFFGLSRRKSLMKAYRKTKE